VTKGQERSRDCDTCKHQRASGIRCSMAIRRIPCSYEMRPSSERDVRKREAIRVEA
jgi:hypothetical protein